MQTMRSFQIGGSTGDREVTGLAQSSGNGGGPFKYPRLFRRSIIDMIDISTIIGHLTCNSKETVLPKRRPSVTHPSPIGY